MPDRYITLFARRGQRNNYEGTVAFFPITSCVCNCSRVGCLLELDVLLQ